MESQFIILPEVIAAKDRVSIGEVRFGSSSWVLWSGGCDVGDQRSERVSRVEYAAVSIVASMNTIKIREFIGLNMSISKMRSFE